MTSCLGPPLTAVFEIRRTYNKVPSRCPNYPRGRPTVSDSLDSKDWISSWHADWRAA